MLSSMYFWSSGMVTVIFSLLIACSSFSWSGWFEYVDENSLLYSSPMEWPCGLPNVRWEQLMTKTRNQGDVWERPDLLHGLPLLGNDPLLASHHPPVLLTLSDCWLLTAGFRLAQSGVDKGAGSQWNICTSSGSRDKTRVFSRFSSSSSSSSFLVFLGF